MSNLNYHNIGKSVFDDKIKKDSLFAEYRRQWKENPAKGIVSDFPLHLDIESTNACNLKCPYCASSSNLWGDNKKGFMDFDLFKKIIDEAVSECCYCVKFSLRGEPLLHPQLPEMIKYAVDSGIIDCYFNTNGMLLTEDMINMLIEAGLPRLSVSIDGWDKASFEKNRLGADYNIVVKNIENLLRIRNISNFSYPKVRVQAVMLPDMKLHWHEYVNFWKNISDEVGYLDARDEGTGFDHRGITESNFSCPFLWQRMTILWDGTLLPCLMHGVEDFNLMTFGNAKDISIKESWNSIKENEYRELHRQGKTHEIEACDKCSYRALEIKKKQYLR
jgi:radical SAM protein with 4Fe4S-binding SPASM domain